MFSRYASFAAVALMVALLAVQINVRSKGRVEIQDDQGRQVSDVLERQRRSTIVEGEVIVLRTPAAAPIGPAVMNKYKVAPELRVTSGGELVLRVPSTTGAAGESNIEARTMALVEELRKEETTVYAQPNYRYHIVQSKPNDERFDDQWHYLPNGAGAGNAPGGIGLPAVWESNKGDDSIVVAVIDSGILKKHPDVVDSKNILPGYDMISDSFVANDGDEEGEDERDMDATDTGDAVAAGECGGGLPEEAEPSSWHGSHVAGTVGVGLTDNKAGVAGINWKVKVLPIRVLGKCGGSTVDIADAIRWAAGIEVAGAPV